MAAAFLVAPLSAVGMTLLLLPHIGTVSGNTEIINVIMVSYSGALVFGLPLLGIARWFRWQGPIQFAGLGALAGAMTYWVLWELLPIAATYRDNRYDLKQAITAMPYFEFPEIGLLSALSGAVSAVTFWLIIRLEKIHRPPDMAA